VFNQDLDEDSWYEVTISYRVHENEKVKSNALALIKADLFSNGALLNPQNIRGFSSGIKYRHFKYVGHPYLTSNSPETLSGILRFGFLNPKKSDQIKLTFLPWKQKHPIVFSKINFKKYGVPRITTHDFSSNKSVYNLKEDEKYQTLSLKANGHTNLKDSKPFWLIDSLNHQHRNKLPSIFLSDASRPRAFKPVVLQLEGEPFERHLYIPHKNDFELQQKTELTTNKYKIAFLEKCDKMSSVPAQGCAFNSGKELRTKTDKISSTLPVRGNQMYRLFFLVRGVPKDGERGSLVRFKFKDKTGALLPLENLSYSHSNKVGYYKYIKYSDYGGIQHIDFVAPDKTDSLLLTFQGWANQQPILLGPQAVVLPHSDSCGDAITSAREACDDGNQKSGDGCSADCKTIERCGNGIMEPGEECDSQRDCVQCFRLDASCKPDLIDETFAKEYVFAFFSNQGLEKNQKEKKDEFLQNFMNQSVTNVRSTYIPALDFENNAEEQLITKSLLKFRFFPSLTLPSPDNIDWTINPFSSEIWMSNFHSLNWLTPYLKADRAKMRSYIISWIKNNFRPCNRGQRSWDDHTAARRLEFFSALMANDFREDLYSDSEFFYFLLSSSIQHAIYLDGLLNNAAFSVHNHSFFHARALFLFSGMNSLFPQHTNFYRKSKNRLLELVDLLTTADGFSIEQSTNYHWLLIQIFDLLYLSIPESDYFTKYLRGVLSTKLTKLIQTLELFINKDGSTIRLGDTGETNALRTALKKMKQSKPYLNSPSFDIVKGSGDLMIFEDTGYIFVKTPESNGQEESVFLDFSKQVHSHGHYDALSFTYSIEKANWVIDSGGPFAYGPAPEYHYFRSSFAHNVCLPANKGQIDGDSRLLHIRNDSSGKHFIFETNTDGSSTRRHIRHVIAPKQGGLVVADKVDFLETENEIVTCYLHFEPTTSVKQINDRNFIKAKSSSGNNMYLHVGGARNLNLEISRGQTTPLQGWTTHKIGIKEASPTISYSAKGQTLTLYAIFHRSKAGAKALKKLVEAGALF
jgi:cysteine-rich repeat protein